ncbi:MAG: DUF2184 domain-containing protein [Burkholderiales bacterium]
MSTLSFMVSQLDRLDPKLHQPLYSTSWSRDVTVRGDINFGHMSTSFVRHTMGAVGSQSPTGKPWLSPKATALPGVTLDGERIVLPIRPLGMELSYTSIELERSQLLSTSIDQAQFDALNIFYQMTTDEMVYIGDAPLAVTGLLNDATVGAALVAADGTGASTLWTSKTTDQIIRDVNAILTAAWTNSGFTSVPNRLLISPAEYAYISNTPRATVSDTTIKRFIEMNNLSTEQNGGELMIEPVKWLTGRGAGGTNRMVAYTMDADKVRFPMIPIRRETPYNLGIHYNSPYIWAYGQMEVIYPECMLYRDGI